MKLEQVRIYDHYSVGYSPELEMYIMNSELNLRFLAELYTHLSDDEQNQVISLIISILSKKESHPALHLTTLKTIR